MRGLLSVKQPLYPHCRFDSGKLHWVIDPVFGYFVRRCCNCGWCNESSCFYQRGDEPFLTVIEFFREYAETDLLKLLCLELPHSVFGGYGSGALVKGTASPLGVGAAVLKGRYLNGQYLLFCQWDKINMLFECLPHGFRQ